jgi:hypothetical protein
LEIPPVNGTVNISFDWKNLLSGESIPSGMKLYFYSGDGNVVMKESDETGFDGILPDGIYHVLAFNSDATEVGYRNLNKYTDAEVYVPVQTKAAVYVSQPLHVYGIGLDCIAVSGVEELNRTVTPNTFVRKATIKVIVTGQKSAIVSCSATLDGIAQGVNIATGAIDQSGTGTISFVPLSTADGFESIVRFFGRVVSDTNTLKIVFNYQGGGSQVLNVDVSSALKDINTKVVEVAINVNFDVSVTTVGEFTATLKEWSSENRQVIAE